MAVLTKEETQEQVLLCLAMGSIFPLFGVVEPSPGILQCECGRSDCKNAGKHPRWRNYKKRASNDVDVVRGWFKRYPNANYGVVTSAKIVALDLDVRPDANGLATLEYLQIDEGERLPYTVEVVTGRGNGSRHLYFNVPADARIRTRAKVLPGVDIRADGGYCVSAGSRHICGGFYHFASECRPDEQAVAVMPDFLLGTVFSDPTVVSQPQVIDNGPALPFWETTSPTRTTLPDSVVLGVMHRDPVARFYLNGGRRNRTPSEDDFALACKLAFYCRHNLGQMYRLFMRSGLYRKKFDTPRKGGNYALRTLKEAIEVTPQTWIRKKRQRPSVAIGAKKGRKVLSVTSAILELHRTEPNLSAVEIAARLEVRPKRVRDAIRYHCHPVAENAWPLIHNKGIALDSGTHSHVESSQIAA